MTVKPNIYGLGRMGAEGFVMGVIELIIFAILIIIFGYLVWKCSKLK